MSTTTLLLSAMTVFLLMLAGIVLTVLEFKYGAPKHQEEAARARQDANNSENQEGLTPIVQKQF